MFNCNSYKSHFQYIFVSDYAENIQAYTSIHTHRDKRTQLVQVKCEFNSFMIRMANEDWVHEIMCFEVFVVQTLYSFIICNHRIMSCHAFYISIQCYSLCTICDFFYVFIMNFLLLYSFSDFIFAVYITHFMLFYYQIKCNVQILHEFTLKWGLRVCTRAHQTVWKTLKNARATSKLCDRRIDEKKRLEKKTDIE